MRNSLSEYVFPIIIVASDNERRIQMNSIEKAKKIDDLIRHLRDDCGIAISGSERKQQLTQYGYYYGYKGYRFLTMQIIKYPTVILTR